MDVQEFLEDESNFDEPDATNEEKEVAKKAMELLTSADLGSYVQSVGPVKARDTVKDIVDADDVEELEITADQKQLT
jgi:predicted acyltransferase (DUF342 family)